MNPFSEARHVLGRARMKILRRLGFWGDEREGALTGELKFWDEALGVRGLHRTEWRHLLEANLELQDDLKQLIPAPEGSVVRILDVGSGPLTYVGKRWAGREVQITPTDPLAEQYNQILTKFSIHPPVRPVAADAEKLEQHFSRDHFDLAYARNSLDHAYDPLAAIRSMLAVVKPLHFVYLWHVANEGVRERYVGLHQWNFDIRQGEFIIDSGRKKQSVNAAFASVADVSCEMQRSGSDNVVVAKLKKLKPVGA
jgi:SAM-dependent methyltransferase